MRHSQVILTRTQMVSLGVPAAQAVSQQAEALGAQRVFILAGATLARETDEISRIEQALGSRHAATHTGIKPHGPREDVLAAANHARSVNADLVVTVGGGSVTDAGKVMLLCLKHRIASVEDFEPYHTTVDASGNMVLPVFEGPDIPIVCVPVTLSGGEFNPLSGATDTAIKQKQAYTHPDMAPVAVVLDPAITVHTPEWLWLSTGVRAVDHASETLGSLFSNAFFDGMAESALKLLNSGLPRVKADPRDLEARLDCQVGAWQSMIPIIGGVPMGASHAIGHVLGGTCGVSHGHTSCVMAPYVQAWNAGVNGERQRRISAALGHPDKAASELLDALIRSLGMPRTLREVGVDESQFPLIAEYALEDMWGRTNPRPIQSVDDVIEVLNLALG